MSMSNTTKRIKEIRRSLVWLLLRCLTLFTLAPPGRCDPRPVFAMGREYPMKTSQMDSWFGYQGDQLGDEIQCFEYYMSGAIVVGRFELVADLTIAG